MLPVKGIVLSFFGLGGQQMFDEDPAVGKELAQEGIIYIIPYNNPWAWMNPQAVRYTDEIIDTIISHYSLADNIPIVSSGGSMGGLSALVYTRYAKRTPAVCVANCPVCDLPYHYTERPDLPRTLYSAFFNSEAISIEKALESASPIHLADEMPDIPYYIFHCESDLAVNINKHSERFVTEMRKKHNVSYFTVPGRGHCDLDEYNAKLFSACIKDPILSLYK